MLVLLEFGLYCRVFCCFGCRSESRQLGTRIFAYVDSDRAAWTNYQQQQQQQQVHPIKGPSNGMGVMPSIPPPPPYPPPPLPSTGGPMAPPFPAPPIPTGGQDGHRHLSDDGSLPSGGSK
ncbi:unnamed protein product [Rodentolepis nana]|uniref:WH1 domain-containing protein n=1 Tax=Rodentolepis nana TaxID=102285 RepID=A0A0R3TDC4_RODNA|nr:unnamed protein product [Rodentolepis nana]